MNKKIIIENWTDHPIENLLSCISTAMREKRSYYNLNKVLIFEFDDFMVQYEKKKNSDKWIIYKKE